MATKYGDWRDNFLEGTALPDTLGGRGGDDHIKGYSGSDRIYGDTGNDWLEGHGGNDVIYGGPGQDRIDGSFHNDWVHGGSGHDSVRGGSGNDRVYGDSGHDTIFGDAGADTLYGGTGGDRAFGGAGRDVFVYGSASEVGSGRFERIAGFRSGEDGIDISGWDARPGMTGRQKWDYVSLLDIIANPEPGQMTGYYDRVVNETIVYFNMDYDGAAEREIVLEGGPTLASRDFIF
jgi:Ca2+-binding RTX toxin-like protein